MNKELIRISKFLSLVLRHKPETIGITLDPQGWVDVDVLLAASRRAGVPLSGEILRQVVAQNNKQRFALSSDGLRIRANQGHSVPVDLGLFPRIPPKHLFHGTATRFLSSIAEKGLLPGRRTHVHLSVDEQTARAVGRRHGTPVILTVQARRMHDEGFLFYCSDNGVWLIATVPPEFLIFPAS